MARTKPTAEYFGDLAAEYSIESSSRVLRGEVPPIKKHGGQPVLEEEAFSLKPGELSGVIQVEDRCIILFCEGFTQPTNVHFAAVRDLIYEDIFEKKLAHCHGRLLRATAGCGHDRQLPGRHHPLSQTRERGPAYGRPAEVQGIASQVRWIASRAHEPATRRACRAASASRRDCLHREGRALRRTSTIAGPPARPRLSTVCGCLRQHARNPRRRRCSFHFAAFGLAASRINC